MAEDDEKNKNDLIQRYLSEYGRFLNLIEEQKGYSERLMVAHGGALATTYAFISQSSLLSPFAASLLIRGFSIGLVLSIGAFILAKLAADYVLPPKPIKLRLLTFSMLAAVAVSVILFMVLVGLAALLIPDARSS